MIDKAAIYVRVGSPSQRSQHDSQIVSCERYAKDNDLLVVKVYADISSGNNKILVERFSEIIKDMNNLGISTLLVADTSRISRNELNYYEIIKRFRKNNKFVYSVGEGTMLTDLNSALLTPTTSSVNETILNQALMKRYVIDDFDYNILGELGYTRSLLEGGYISEDRATIVIDGRRPYIGQVKQFKQNRAEEHLMNVAELQSRGYLKDSE